MTNLRKSFGWVLLISAMIGLVFAFFRTSADRAETMVQGRPLSAWVRELGNPNLEATNRTRARETLAAQRLTIIPELLAWRDSSVRAPFDKLAAEFGRMTGMTAQPFNASIAKGELLSVVSQIAQKNNMAFERRPEFQACADQLLQQLKADPANKNIFFWAIGAFGVNATNALPTLIASLPTTFSTTNFPHAMLLHAIAEIGPGPYSQQVIPAATNLLSSSKDTYTALRALGACGTNAQPFIPQLVEIVEAHEEHTRTALGALAQLGPLPKELKPFLAERMDRGSWAGPAAVAMLQIDSKEPTALNIVQARLHPLAGGDHVEMMQLLSRVPSVAKLFVPDLEKLASKTNEPTSYLARQILRGTANEAR